MNVLIKKYYLLVVSPLDIMKRVVFVQPEGVNL